MVSDTGVEGEPKRLHPATILVAIIRGAPSTLLGLPAVLAVTSSMNLALVLAIAATAFLGAAALRWVAWRRFTYVLTDDAVVIESGVLSRNRRTIPYERIADAGIEQGLLQRLFGLATLSLETGGSGQDEGKLDSVSVAEAEQLRAVLRRERAAPSGAETAKDQTDLTQASLTPVLFAMDTGRVLLWGLFNFSLVWIAVGLGALQFLGPLLGLDNETLLHTIATRTGMIASRSNGSLAAAIASSAALVVVLGVVAGLIRTMLRDYGFTLSGDGGRLRRVRGLLTRSEAVIALPRIQLAAIDSGPVRRRLGWQQLRGQLLGGEGATGRQDLAPLARPDEVDRLLAVLRLSRVDPAEMIQVSHRHVWRAVLRNIALPAVVIAAAALWKVAALFALPLLLPLLAVALLRRKHHRYALNGDLLQVQRGVVGRTLWLVPMARIQSISLSCGWIQRRLGLASVRIDTAGAGMFDGPDIHDLKAHDAATLMADLIQRVNAQRLDPPAL
ncbi:PH domain-containing protein [Sphingomonas sp.]|uniref:PH domain-containing protein n=1 Tax=Sphingomonas sp. TaxID=28214 RepID=UPI003D6D7124